MCTIDVPVYFPLLKDSLTWDRKFGLRGRRGREPASLEKWDSKENLTARAAAPRSSRAWPLTTSVGKSTGQAAPVRCAALALAVAHTAGVWHDALHVARVFADVPRDTRVEVALCKLLGAGDELGASLSIHGVPLNQ